MAGLIEQLVARESTSCTSPGDREGHWKWVAHLTFLPPLSFQNCSEGMVFPFLDQNCFWVGINFSLRLTCHILMNFRKWSVFS